MSRRRRFPKLRSLVVLALELRRRGFLSFWIATKRGLSKRIPDRRYRPTPISSARAETRILIEPSSILEVPSPDFIGQRPPTYPKGGRHGLLSPRLEITEIKNVVVMGGTDLLFRGTEVIHPDFFNPNNEVSPAETFDQIEFGKRTQTINTRFNARKSVPYALSLISQCEGNYAHFMVEVLPKLALLNESGLFADAPILMAKWSHPNIHSAMQWVNRGQREVILVDRWEPVRVNQLICVSPAAYIMAEHRDYQEAQSMKGISGERFPFSRTALISLKEALLAEATGSFSPPTDRGFYYIQRSQSGNSRRAVNADALQEYAVKRGFKVIDPGTMSFSEQIDSFKGARIVVGQVGAALVNTLFAEAGCSVIGVSPYFEGGNYYFWTNFMETIGHKIKYVIGPQVESGNHLLHRDYTVDLSSFKTAIEEALRLH